MIMHMFSTFALVAMLAHGVFSADNIAKVPADPDVGKDMIGE